jgi:oligopeptide transport system ATP-binding protein
MAKDAPFLELRNLSVEMRDKDRRIRVLDDVSLAIRRGTTLGVVGESGCGKSMTALAIMRLLPPGFEITSGQILLDGEDIARQPEARIRALRGNDISMIFQEPMTSLNPVFTVGDQIAEAVRQHQNVTRAEAAARALDMMRAVQIPAAESRLDAYPHEFSGGMRQRVMIAMALLCRPDLLIADEPTTALDVTVQAQIMELLAELQRDFGMAMVLITHDLGVIAGSAERVMVMYGGRVMERAPVGPLFADPAHPYTQGLLAAIPRVDQKGDQLSAISGSPPNMTHPPAGCPFAPRCAYPIEQCQQTMPPLTGFAPERERACHVPLATVRAGHAPQPDLPEPAAADLDEVTPSDPHDALAAPGIVAGAAIAGLPEESADDR